MNVVTLVYDRRAGWSGTFPADFNSPQTLVIVFGAASFLDTIRPVQDLVRHLPLARMIGCSTGGEILGRTISDDTLTVALVRFEKTYLNTAAAPVLDAAESFDAGEEIAGMLYKPNLRGVLLLSDGLNVNGSELVAGINSILPASVVVTGGLAGDGERFRKTWVIKDGVPQSNFVTAVGFYGKHVRIGHGSHGGANVFGPERIVTRSKGNELYELDGRPALELYKNYLGVRAFALPASALHFPLALRPTESSDKHVVRTVLSVNEERKSMTFAGDVPEGARAQLTRASFDHLISGAAAAAGLARRSFAGADDRLAIAISCVSRRQLLGERAEEELDAVMDGLPDRTTQVGFYSYGDISPYPQGHCDLHNQTITLTIIGEE